MGLKKAKLKTKKNYATFMFVPESESTVKAFRIPSWFPKFTFLSIAALVIVSLMCMAGLAFLKLQQETSQKEIDRLVSINSAQKTEIEKLMKSSSELQKQLEENSKMLEEVKKAVGIKTTSASPDSQENSDTISSSGSGTLTYELLKYNKKTDLTNDIKTLEASFTSLNKEIAAQKQEIADSIKPIQAKVTYLLAKPSIYPVAAAITCSFGYRKNPFTSRGSEFHRGIDFGAPYGATVSATGDGVVLFSGWHAGYGRVVILSHGYGLTTLYAHNSKLLVKQGDKVKKGSPIAKVGNTGRSTGTHLHYEVKLNGKNVNPAKYLETTR